MRPAPTRTNCNLSAMARRRGRHDLKALVETRYPIPSGVASEEPQQSQFASPIERTVQQPADQPAVVLPGAQPDTTSPRPENPLDLMRLRVAVPARRFLVHAPEKLVLGQLHDLS